ncbi:MAG: transposase [Ignavibacteriae bacterium]|nr:transposase [Ignavibacteriota bacterium]
MSHWKIIEEKETEFYFLTATIVDWTAIFLSHKYFEILIQSLKHCQEKKELRVAGYVIMPNHIHLIAAGSLTHRLSDTMRDFKRFTAGKIIETLQEDHRTSTLMIFQQAALLEERGNEHKVWIDGNHPILVEDGFMFQEKLKYLHDNPVRKGYVDQPEHWVYSSARNYVHNDNTVFHVECLH